MKKLTTLFAICIALASTQLSAVSSPNVAVVDFKQCADDSALGKQQQKNFEGLKQQIQEVMQGKEKEIKEYAEKFQDADYLDSLSPEAEETLKAEFQKANYEYNQMAQQFSQSLQQANMQIVRLIDDAVKMHTKEVAKKRSLDFVLNAESTFYFDTPFDLTDEVVSAMDRTFDKQEKEAESSAE